MQKMFKKATKKGIKLRMALCGPAGAGKTYSALSIASALGGKIAVVDTEHGSASKYADLFEFDVVEPEKFDPRDLIETIKHAQKTGYQHIIIDSLSHYWSGKGGELEMVDNAARRSSSGNSFAAWKTVTPVHNELIDTIIGSKINVFVTMRTKTEWVIEKDDRGKSAPRKVGLAPIMRDGIEFEFDLCGEIDQDNNFVVTKSRCPELSGITIHRPGKNIADILARWLNSGESTETPAKRVETFLEVKTPAEPEKTTPAPAKIKATTLRDKLKEAAPEFYPEDAEIVDPIPEVKAADRPARAGKSAVAVANELKHIRELAVTAGCKNAIEIKELYEAIVGRPLEAATSLSDAERENVKNYLLNKIAEKEAANNG
jgi:hypothetical protein